jgi:hypothetical protein
MSDNATAGAMPVVPDATSGQTAATETPPTVPATGTEVLGEAGTRALQAERANAKAAAKRADDAEKALEALKLAGASETEKAIAAARKEGAIEVTERFHAQVRRSEVKAALAGAGINPSVLDLAAKADEFSGLTVNDDGEVEGLAQAVAAFKTARADLFATKRPTGSADAGSTTAAGAPATTFTRAQLRDPEFYQANKADILAAMQGGRIRG